MKFLLILNEKLGSGSHVMHSNEENNILSPPPLTIISIVASTQCHHIAVAVQAKQTKNKIHVRACSNYVYNMLKADGSPRSLAQGESAASIV